MPLADHHSDEDLSVDFQLPADAFGPLGPGTIWSATLAGGGALPAWLSFDANSRTFSGTPPANFNGTLDIEVSVTDGPASASDIFSLFVDPINDAPTASGSVVYQDDFEGSAAQPWQTALNDLLQAFPLDLDEEPGGNNFVTSTGPWWLDPNHVHPGAGYFHLLAFAYVTHIMGESAPQYSYSDATFSFDINLDELNLPDGAQVYFWFQSQDYLIDRSVNYILSSTPLETLTTGGGWTSVSLTLSSDDADWTALGSNLNRLATYGVSQSIAHALASQVLDFGIVVFLGNDSPPVLASGDVRFDNFSLQLNPEALRSFREYDVNTGIKPLNIGLSLSDVDGGDFDGGSYAVAFAQGAETADRLSIISDPIGNGIVQTGTDLLWAGQIIGSVQGGTAGSSLVVTFNASATLAAIEALGLAIGYSRTANEPAAAKQINVTFADGDGGVTEVALFDLQIVGQTESDGDDTYIVDDLSPANWPLIDEGGFDTIDATALTTNASIVLGAAPYYPALSKVIYTPPPTAIEKVLSGSGNDFLWGSSLTDHLDGGPGHDDIYGQDGDDLLFGNGGNDNIEGGAGADQINGGDGFDVAYYTGLSGLIVDLIDNLLNTSHAQGDVLTSVEGVSGTDGDDGIYGNNDLNALVGRLGHDLLVGRGGNDQLFGNAGNDTLIGNEGTDTLDGGDGFDTASYAQAATGVVADLLLPEQNAGEAAGDIFVSIEALTGSPFNDTLNGSGAEDHLEGGDGQDSLFGRGGNDSLFGGAAADILNGGLGDDQLTGNGGADRFRFTSGWGHDTIEDWQPGSDLIDFTLFVGLTFGDLTLVQAGPDAEVTFLTSKITLRNVLAVNLTAADFDFRENPVAAPDSLGTTEDQAATFGANALLDNDTAPMGDALAIASVANAVGGAAVHNIDGSVTFTPNPDFNGEASFDYVVVDTLGANATGHVTITVAPVDDPAVARDDSFAGNEASTITGSVMADNGSGADVDIDSPLSVVAVNGTAAFVGIPVTLASGARLTLNSNGSFTYDPNHAFDTLPAPGSGASNTTATDGFTYTLAGGAIATATVSISGLDSDDVLIGTSGIDAFIGGGGSDWYFIDNPGDSIVEPVGGGALDRAFASVSYTLTPGAYIEILSTADNLATTAINLTGNELDQLIYGNAGNNILTGGGGNDTLIGFGGDDWYYVDSASDVVNEDTGGGFDRVLASTSYVLSAGTRVEKLTTADNLATTAINLTGNELDQLIYGNAGNNILTGGGGNDTLIGFGGDDWYYVDGTGDLINESAGGGFDRVLASANYVLNAGASVEILSTSDNLATTAISLTGNELGQLIYGNAGNNILAGGGGSDTLIGFGGDDWYYVNSASDLINEAVSGGSDRVLASTSYVLNAGASIEILSTTDNLATTAINLTGNGRSQLIYGNAGNNILTGGGGIDTLIGFGGDDWYYVDGTGDLINEIAGGGFDRVLASASYVLNAGASVEILSTADNLATTAISLTGNELGQLIYGNAGNNILAGGGGNDTLIGFGGDDWYYVDGTGDMINEAVGGGSDRVLASTSYVLNAGASIEILSTADNLATTAINLTGNGRSQLIYGNAGNNILTGGGGNDTLIGFSGDDWYYVDGTGDMINEAVGGGSDRVLASANYVLNAGASVEILSTTDNLATTAISLTGNELGQLIYGNAGNNTLAGGGGSDTLIGFGGDDWYYVDGTGDMINESAGGGFDRVLASASYVLNAGASVEILSTADNLATTAISLTGNELGQLIYGNAGNNILAGGGGNDTLIGFGGDDWYYVDGTGDLINESAGGGFDRVLASANYVLNAGTHVEKLTTADNLSTQAINLTGNERGQLIYGNAGNNTLTGGGGNDTLIGLGGDDQFVFSSPLGPDNLIAITDFQTGADKIVLDDSVFTGISLGALPAQAFAIGNVAQDADDRLIYNPETGVLRFDADGNGSGAAIHFATLTPGLELVAADFLVI